MQLTMQLTQHLSDPMFRPLSGLENPGPLVQLLVLHKPPSRAEMAVACFPRLYLYLAQDQHPLVWAVWEDLFNGIRTARDNREAAAPVAEALGGPELAPGAPGTPAAAVPAVVHVEAMEGDS